MSSARKVRLAAAAVKWPERDVAEHASAIRARDLDAPTDDCRWVWFPFPKVTDLLTGDSATAPGESGFRGSIQLRSVFPMQWISQERYLCARLAANRH
jgi:hypothetical protein